MDGILSLYINIVEGMKVYPKMIEKHLNDELPFMATEAILMHCTKKGGNRQELHEAIRRHSVAAAEQVKLYGRENDLMARILADPIFGLSQEDLAGLMQFGNFTGRAAEQTEEFLRDFVEPVLAENKDALGVSVEITV